MPRRATRISAVAALLVVLATACASTAELATAPAPAEDRSEEPTPTVAVVAAVPSHPEDWPGVTTIPDVYDPVAAGESQPDGFRQLLGRDLIKPIYEPTFVPSNGVGWPDDELVLGVFLGNEARAYPIGLLNQREIVIDIHRGIPTLVTW